MVNHLIYLHFFVVFGIVEVNPFSIIIIIIIIIDMIKIMK